MAASTILSSKFQISIPKDVRESQNWRPGQKLAFVPKGSGYVLAPVPSLDDLWGFAKGANPEGYRDRNDRY